MGIESGEIFGPEPTLWTPAPHFPAHSGPEGNVSPVQDFKGVIHSLPHLPNIKHPRCASPCLHGARSLSQQDGQVNRQIGC